MDKRFIEDIVADVRGDYESRLAERRQFESQWQLNGNFVMGNQYCRIGLRGELDAMRAREGELIRELDERRTPDYAAIASDEEFIDAYARRSELIKAKVIADYLRSLSHTGGVRLLGESVGKSALAPLKKPKTLSEAKKLAELYIKE